MSKTHMGTTFTCTRCHKSLTNDRPDEEIEAELQAQGITDINEEGVELICDDCFHADPECVAITEKTQEILERVTH